MDRFKNALGIEIISTIGLCQCKLQGAKGPEHDTKTNQYHRTIKKFKLMDVEFKIWTNNEWTDLKLL